MRKHDFLSVIFITIAVRPPHDSAAEDAVSHYSSPPSARSTIRMVKIQKIGTFLYWYSNRCNFFVFESWKLKFKQRSHLSLKRSFLGYFIVAVRSRGYPMISPEGPCETEDRRFLVTKSLLFCFS